MEVVAKAGAAEAEAGAWVDTRFVSCQACDIAVVAASS